MSGINQKEYLKKYLGIGKGSGEKKKKKKSKNIRLRIFDDDLDGRLEEEIQLDLTADNEEAPQIVSVIDDRPPSLRIDEETRSKLWKPIGAPDTSDPGERNIKFEGHIKLIKNLGTKQRDSSPDRKKVMKRELYSLKNQKTSGPDERSDASLSKNKSKSTFSDKDFLPVRHSSKDTDHSPPRRGRRYSNSPPSKRNNSPHRSRSDRDSSPVRKRRKSVDFSPPRRKQNKDMSPPRRNRTEKNEDLSPPRKMKGSEEISSPPRRTKREKSEDSSPSRRRKTHKKSRWDDSEETNERMKKTLDGKTAGLQNAVNLAKETEELKKREDELFRNLSSEVSGANAATIVRRKKNETDVEEEERKRKIEQANKEKYDRWGKGLKQVEDINEKMKNDLYEMSKPLARYADDEDLERDLKNQEREGDPMLAYIRQKKRRKAIEGGLPVIQQYEGDAPPNRFGIRPGYRWDGVDRSSGYERKWFEVQNSRKASLEESYKWSTEDM